MRPAVASRPASLYEAVLGDAFATLAPCVQRAHIPPLVARGSFDVEHGSHPLTAFFITLLQLPAPGAAQPVNLEVRSTTEGIAWMRRIGATESRTTQYARGTRLVEAHGPGEIEFELQARQGALEYRQVAMRAARVPLPAFIRPHVRALVTAAPRGWHVEVTVRWRNHLICRYAGAMAEA